MAGALLFVVGYFAGSRYASPPLGDVDAVVVETAPLLAPAGVNLSGAWHVLAVGRGGTPACEQLLTRLVRVHNRLAHRRDLQDKLVFLFLDAGDERRGGAARPSVPTVTPVSPAAARGFGRQLGRSDEAALDCRGTPLALLDPEARLRALLPAAGDPVGAARDLERLLDHMDD